MVIARIVSILVLLATIIPVVYATDSESLVIYSGRSNKFVKPVADAFTKDTGIKVVIHSASSTELINKLRVENKATDADLYISNDAGNLQIGADLGLFTAVADEVANSVEPNYRGKDNTWIGLSARARVLVVNSKKMKDLDFVKSVSDIADERLKGRLAITTSANESFIAGVTVYKNLIGDEKTLNWLKGIKRNAGTEVYNKHSKIVKDVAAGKKDIGLVNHYYIYRHLDKKPKAPIAIVLPDQGENGIGVAWNVAGVAIVKHSKRQAQAKKFVEFVVSKAGQKLFAEVNREYPTRKDVPAAAEIPPAGSFKIANIPMYELGKQRAQTLDLIESAGMY